MIVGCKKTLVEYRGLVNRNRYYLRISIRMGGLFSRNEFMKALSRAEYFPIATSPTTPPFLTTHTKSSPSPYPNTPHFPTPNSPTNSHSHTHPQSKSPPFPQSHPHSLHNPRFYLHFFQKPPIFPINSTKSNQKLQKSPKISPKSTKFTPKNHPNFPTITHLYLKMVAKTPF